MTRHLCFGALCLSAGLTLGLVAKAESGSETQARTQDAKLGASSSEAHGGLFSVRLAGGGSDEPAELFIDGLSVGVLPWTGTLPPGARTFTVRQGERGTAPARALPRGADQIIALTNLKLLGPEVRVTTDLESGELSVNQVPVNNPWVGRLPIGRQVLSASLEGRAAVIQVLDVTPHTPRNIVIKLDEEAQATALADKKRRSIEFVPALLIGTTIGSEAEEVCAQTHCTDNSAAWGTLTSARLGYRFIEHLSFELSAGLLYLSKQQTRRFTDTELPEFEAVSYDLTDKLRVRGPFVSAGVAFEKRLGAFGVGGRLHAGVSHIFARHRTQGTMSTDDETERVRVSHSDAVQRSSMVMGLPELFVGYRRSAWQLGAGLGALVIMNRAPVSRHGQIRPELRETGACDNIHCAPPSERIMGERPYGPSIQASFSIYGGLRF